MKALQELLAVMPTGPVPEDINVNHALAECWERLKGNAEGGMEAYKLLGRMENVQWNSPVLTFTIERHGGTVNGSTRAELQHWEVNLDEQTACIVKEGHRQLEPMAPRMSIKAIAEEVGVLILGGKMDERIRRQEDGCVKIVMSKLFPSDSGFKRTVKSRRQRLAQYVGDQLAKQGWVASGNDGFRPIENTKHQRVSHDLRKTPA
ncbi:MAG: hypothetical protein AABP62_10430 [Planctomycetota bacterium]